MSDIAISTMKKFEAFFKTLGKAEQDVVSDMVRASLVQVAERMTSVGDGEAGAVSGGNTLPGFVVGITSLSTPNLVKSLSLPGTLAAHSIPGCNASSLVNL